MAAHRVERLVLDIGVKRGLDGQATACQVLAVDAFFVEVFQHVVAEETAIARADAAIGQGIGAIQYTQGFLGKGIGVLLGEGAGVGHGLEHHVAAFDDAFLIGVRVEILRGLHHAGEHRCLRHREVLGTGTKVGAGRSLNAIGVVTKGHEVEVISQNLILGQLGVDIRGHAHLAQLAGYGLFRRGLAFLVGRCIDQEEIVLYILLVQRRCTLGDAACGQIGPQSAQIALQIDTFVLVETAVLDGHDRLLHGIRDFIRLHRMAALLVDIGKGVALGIQDGAHARGLAVGEILDVRLHRVVRPGHGNATNAGDGGDGQRDEDADQCCGQDELSQGFDHSHPPHTSGSGADPGDPPKV